MNQRSADFLDVHLDLDTESYSPYAKENHVIKYVHVLSNHPPANIKNLSKGVQTRLSLISQNEHIFNTSKPRYEMALSNSGHNSRLQFDPEADTKNKERVEGRRRRCRKRDIIWYNPPFNGRLQTNYGQEFLKIVDTCFPQGHPLHRTFNRNKLKLSYSTMPNLLQIIQKHNANLLRKHREQMRQGRQERTCNCRQPEECPMSGNCLASEIVYQATVTVTGEDRSTTGGSRSTTSPQAGEDEHGSTPVAVRVTPPHKTTARVT